MEKNKLKELIEKKASFISCELADVESLSNLIYQGKHEKAENGYISMFGKDSLYLDVVDKENAQ